MAKYIKQEMKDLSGKGEKKVYYHLQTKQNINFMEFIKETNNIVSSAEKSMMGSAVIHITDTLARLLSEGYSVTIDGLGTFKATLGLEEDKVMDNFDTDAPKLNARSLRLTGINYRADKNLIKEANRRCKLERAGESRLRQSPYTREERLKRAQDYLAKYGAMKVADYVELTGLSRTKATLELKEFRHDVSTGIDTIGRRSTLVYVKRAE